MVIMNFSGIYESQGFYQGENFTWLDLRGVQGTNCYCDREAEREIGDRIRGLGPAGLHFLDSGNYHYASKLWMDMIEEDFELLVLDHHTDMQEPVFGGVLSCGGWVKAALDGNPRLRGVWLAGPSEEGIREAEALGYGDRVTYISESDMEHVDNWQDRMGKTSLPLYISVDKDVLSRRYARTNWDQGNVSLERVLECIKRAARMRRIIGMDVCGEDPEGTGDDKRIVNDRTNRELLDCCLNYIEDKERGYERQRNKDL